MPTGKLRLGLVVAGVLAIGLLLGNWLLSGNPDSVTKGRDEPRAVGPAATKPVGPPTAAVTTAKPVTIGAGAEILPEVLVKAVKVTDVKVTANQPGQVAGPAVAVTLTVQNSSEQAFSLGGMVVNASYGKGTPGPQTAASPSRPLTGNLAPGSTATGVYVFNVPRQDAGSVRVEVASDQSPTVLEFAR